MRALLLVLIAVSGWLGLRQMHAAQANEVALTAEEAEVVVYVAPWCSVCEQARAHLDARGARYVARDIEADPAAFDAYRAAGGAGGIPYFVIGGDAMSGFNADALDARLAALGS
jgi:glutaredoxin